MTAQGWTEEQVGAWGRRLGASLGPEPVWIGLRGPLGAGKSVLARAIARGLGVNDEMPSPTYNLLFEYTGSGERSLAHLDLYRLERAEELDELGWEELGREGQVVLVEWPERAGPFWPDGALEIELLPVPDAPDRRLLRVGGTAIQIEGEPSVPGRSAESGAGASG